MKTFTILFFSLIALLAFKNQAQTMTDIDGNVYHTITIGGQVWMVENLKVTKFKDGAVIPNVIQDTAWKNLGPAAFCWYNNDPANKNIYGALYNGQAVTTGKLAPAGWHVPTDADWKVLENYLKLHGYNFDGTTTGNKYAKSLASVSGWQLNLNEGSVGNTDYPAKRNLTGFTALPGGWRDGDIGAFHDISSNASFWSSTVSAGQMGRYLQSSYNYLIAGDNRVNCGFSVRCVSDSTLPIDEINNRGEIKVFPNPATDKFYIVCHEEQNVTMQVFNVTGECVLQRKLNNFTNEIDISSLSKGVYIIELTGDNRTVQHKLMKE